MKKNIKNSIAFLKKFSVFSVFSVVKIFLLFNISAAAQSKVLIRVSAETTLKNERVLLGDIAEISGANEETASRLKTISLGYAPAIGMTREVFKDRLRLMISAAGFSENSFAIDAPPKIIIRRVGQMLSQNMLRETVEKAILSDFQNKYIAAKIVRLDLPQFIQIPAGNFEIRASASAVANLFAPFSVSIEIRHDEKTVKRFSATAQIEATAEVLVAARDLLAGEKISAADVRRETRRLEKSLAAYLRDEKNLRGTVLLKNLSAGTEITTETVAAGYVVRAGDAVRIVGESGKMQIIINGEARASGKIGDRVSVKNLQSGAILQAVVVDEGIVKVLF